MKGGTNSMSTDPYRRRPSTPLMRTEDKYNSDPAFRHVVDSLQRVIEHLELTPGEVREAAVYACMRVEMSTEPKRTPRELRAENERLRAALRKIREHAAKVEPGNSGTAYYRLGALDAEAAIALDEAIYPREAP